MSGHDFMHNTCSYPTPTTNCKFQIISNDFLKRGLELRSKFDMNNLGGAGNVIDHTILKVNLIDVCISKIIRAKSRSLSLTFTIGQPSITIFANELFNIGSCPGSVDNFHFYYNTPFAILYSGLPESIAVVTPPTKLSINVQDESLAGTHYIKIVV
jgi:hypothetical protein